MVDNSKFKQAEENYTSMPLKLPAQVRLSPLVHTFDHLLFFFLKLSKNQMNGHGEEVEGSGGESGSSTTSSVLSSSTDQ